MRIDLKKLPHLQTPPEPAINAQATKEATSIDELYIVLETIATDDGKAIAAYTVAELVNEAKHVIGLFGDGGSALSEMLDSDDPDERRSAKRQIRQLRAFIAKWA